MYLYSYRVILISSIIALCYYSKLAYGIFYYISAVSILGFIVMFFRGAELTDESSSSGEKSVHMVRCLRYVWNGFRGEY